MGRLANALRVCATVLSLAAVPGCCFFGLGNCDTCETQPVSPSCSSTTSLTGQATLAVSPSLQQTPVWCWAASAEMVFRYYGLPNLNPAGNYQCGIVGAWFGNTACFFNCGLCPVPIGPMSNEYQVITGYGGYARSFGIPSRSLIATLVFRALSANEIKTEIDAGRPIVIGISPGSGFSLPNASQHIGVLIGYDFSATSQTVVVNDPFPFDFAPYNQSPHPYLSRGGSRIQTAQFSIPLSALTGSMAWGNTIFQIQ